MMTDARVRITFRLPAHLADELATLAADEGLSVSGLVGMIVRGALARHRGHRGRATGAGVGAGKARTHVRIVRVPYDWEVDGE